MNNLSTQPASASFIVSPVNESTYDVEQVHIFAKTAWEAAMCSGIYSNALRVERPDTGEVKVFKS